MSRSDGKRGPKWHGKRYFANLKPLGDALNAITAATPRVSGERRPEQRSIDDYAERVEKRQAMLARRAARAGVPKDPA